MDCLSPQKISDSLEPVDGALSAQVELLKDALESGINFNQKGDEDEVQSAINNASELEVDGKGKEEQEGAQRAFVHEEHLQVDGMADSESGGELRVTKGKQYNISSYSYPID